MTAARYNGTARVFLSYSNRIVFDRDSHSIIDRLWFSEARSDQRISSRCEFLSQKNKRERSEFCQCRAAHFNLKESHEVN